MKFILWQVKVDNCKTLNKIFNEFLIYFSLSLQKSSKLQRRSSGRSSFHKSIRKMNPTTKTSLRKKIHHQSAQPLLSSGEKVCLSDFVKKFNHYLPLCVGWIKVLYGRYCMEGIVLWRRGKLIFVQTVSHIQLTAMLTEKSIKLHYSCTLTYNMILVTITFETSPPPPCCTYLAFFV